MKRKGLSKRIRFEVFKRDSFTCQYCGKRAPDAILNADHINPVSSGGDNNILNLITSCFDCNSGKGARTLSDGSIIQKQMDQLTLINERKNQLKMLAQWRKVVLETNSKELQMIKNEINNYLEPAGKEITSDFLNSEIKSCLKKYGLIDTLSAIDKSANQYLKDVESHECRNNFLSKISRICYWQKRERENPDESEFRKIAYTANKIWSRCYPTKLAHTMISASRKHGITPGEFHLMVRASTGIMTFEELLRERINGQKIY